MSRCRSSRRGRLRFAPVLWLLALAGAALGQQMERPPDYSQPAVAVASNDLYSAWKALQASDQDLEQQVFALPMVDARQRIQTTFSSVLAYIDKRRAYGEAVRVAAGSAKPVRLALHLPVGGEVLFVE